MKVNLTRADALQKAITGRYEALGAKERKNSVLAQEFIISASPEFFDGLSDEKVAIWAEHQLKFMKNEFGDNLQVAVLHLDEKTPHLHFLLSCEEKSLKRYKNQKGEFSVKNIASTRSVGGQIFSEIFTQGTPSITKNWD